MNAFHHRLVIAAGLRYYPVRRAHDELLRDLDVPWMGLRSPVRRMRAEPGWLAGMEDCGLESFFCEEERAELVYVFCRPISETTAVLEQGREHFRREAMRVVGNQLPEMLVEELLTLCLRAFQAYIESLSAADEAPAVL